MKTKKLPCLVAATLGLVALNAQITNNFTQYIFNGSPQPKIGPTNPTDAQMESLVKSGYFGRWAWKSEDYGHLRETMKMAREQTVFSMLFHNYQHTNLTIVVKVGLKEPQTVWTTNEYGPSWEIRFKK